jgi:REP element-mobilizing transposase RayT
MARGINQQNIFEADEDFEKYLSILDEVKEAAKFKLYAYCLMGNHVHILLEESDAPLSQIFKQIGIRYVFWFNWKYQRHGHLFQDRFKSEPVENDSYFNVVLRYIHQNPVKAGLCQDAKSYRWSSAQLLGRKTSRIDVNDLERIVPLSDFDSPADSSMETSVLEYGVGRRRGHFENEALDLLQRVSGAKGATDFQRLPKSLQKDAVLKLRTAGIPIRQIARISGFSKGVVETLCKKK